MEHAIFDNRRRIMQQLGKCSVDTTRQLLLLGDRVVRLVVVMM